MGKDFGFTGTQQPLSIAQAEALGGVLGGLEHDGYVWMHNGDCIGADAFAAGLWRDIGGMLHGHPPDIEWKRARFPFDAKWEPKTYRERNADIVLCSDILVACPKTMEEELRSGTWMTIRMARKSKVPIVIVWPDGSVTKEG